MMSEYAFVLSLCKLAVSPASVYVHWGGEYVIVYIDHPLVFSTCLFPWEDFVSHMGLTLGRLPWLGVFAWCLQIKLKSCGRILIKF